MITRESNVHQNLIQFIMREIPDTVIGGLIIGKFNRASELNVHLEINRESTFSDVPASIDRDLLVTIIGNLIDNALEAVVESDTSDKKVTLFLTDLGEDLIIEIADTGRGVPEKHLANMYEVGFSTKNSNNRGWGLALVNRALKQLHGYITYSRSQEGETIFTVAIPKRYSQGGASS